jgi:DNA uptake protein ComE-like DNA-binding protein
VPPGPGQGAPAPGQGAPPPEAAAPAGQVGSTIELNAVTFEQLRAQGLSVTQATRLLAHRERVGRFQSVDELDEIAGFPREFAEDLKRRSTI